MIRLARKEDIDDILTLLQEVLKVHNSLRPDLFKEEGYKYDKNQLSRLIEDENYLIYVYEEDNKVVGHCFVKKMNKEETTSTRKIKTLYIDDLCVKEEYQRRNIATSLYNKVKEYALKNNYYNITLHAYKGNKAIDFYKKLGMDVMYYSFEEVIK